MATFDSPRRHGVLIAASFAALVPITASAEIPALNSDYRAPHVIYLDFDGHVEPAAPHLCPVGNGVFLQEGYTADVVVGDVSAQLDPELIAEVWEAVAEDFAPFNVNVTTDPRYEPTSATGQAVRVAVGFLSKEFLRDGTLGFAPPTCGNSLENPAYLNPHIAHVVAVHLDPSKDLLPTDIAKRISHEAGHLYGLQHHTAPAGFLDDWIMAPVSARASRYVWRAGNNENGVWQDDPEHLAYVLGLRPDEPNPAQFKSTPTTILSNPSVLYAHATFADSADRDDFVFTVARAGQIHVEIIPGLWSSPLAAMGSVEAVEENARYMVQVRDSSGQTLLLCPEARIFTLTATTQPTLIWGDCLTRPATVQVGATYRLRVVRHANSSLRGNIGRYTLLVRSGGTQLPPLPPLFTKP